ncbi:uncharacterized protein [Asterias amurensis]|uniref:uncharacterized protein isoform X1 n=1 Tax=Asterias amurensis TaxID=7602 RepID=UPI003AB6F7DA
MSELKIRVRTRLRKLTDTDQVILPDRHPTRTNRRDRQADEFIRPVYKNRVTIELCPDDFHMMQKDNLEDVIDVEISDDEVMMDEEESDTFEGFDSSPMSASSQSDSLNNAISSPINIPGNSGHAPRVQRPSSGGTPPQCPGYIGRMFPGAQSDSGSPLSSGYGSASRFFHSTSTQTPSTLVFCETLIRLRISSFSGDERQQATRRLRIQPQERRVRNRAYSENNSDDLREEEAEAEDLGASSRMPLPDVVAFRDRSNSAPTNLMRPEISVGRELRRISDEFHLTYHDRQVRLFYRCFEPDGNRIFSSDSRPYCSCIAIINHAMIAMTAVQSDQPTRHKVPVNAMSMASPPEMLHLRVMSWTSWQFSQLIFKHC